MTAADGFHWFVFGFGDMNRLGEFFLANIDTPIMSVIIALVVQGMYAWRVYILSRFRVITGLIIFVGAFAWCVIVVRFDKRACVIVHPCTSCWRSWYWHRGQFPSSLVVNLIFTWVQEPKSWNDIKLATEIHEIFYSMSE